MGLCVFLRVAVGVLVDCGLNVAVNVLVAVLISTTVLVGLSVFVGVAVASGLVVLVGNLVGLGSIILVGVDRGLPPIRMTNFSTNSKLESEILNAHSRSGLYCGGTAVIITLILMAWISKLPLSDSASTLASSLFSLASWFRDLTAWLT